MESIGQTLREARHDKKASLEDASRVTKIKIEILEKLESDEFDQLAAPMYTKGFLKMYSEYLGLDSQTIGDTYLRNQGGLRRQGLHVETDAAIHGRKPLELKLPILGVIGAVAVVSVALVVGLGVRGLWSRRSSAQAPASPTVAQQKATPAAPQPSAILPKADIDAYYQPRTKPAPELLNPLEK